MSAEALRGRREHLLRRLKRLLPGQCSSLQGLLDAAGKYVSDPEQVANMLSVHWGSVFSAADIDRSQLQTWLNEVGDRLPDCDDHCWNI